MLLLNDRCCLSSLSADRALLEGAGLFRCSISRYLHHSGKISQLLEAHLLDKAELHYEIQKYYQSTSKAHANVLQSLVVHCPPAASEEGCVTEKVGIPNSILQSHCQDI